MRMRIAAVDLVSSTCFPALAAEEMDLYRAEGLDAPIELRRFTFAGLAATEALIESDPECVAAAVRAIVKAQKILRREPARARKSGAADSPLKPLNSSRRSSNGICLSMTRLFPRRPSPASTASPKPPA